MSREQGQAHLPAEQSSSRTQARLPAPHAHTRGPGDRVRAQAEGPGPALDLRTARASIRRGCAVLPDHARLRRSEDFRAVMRGGAKAGRRTLVVHALRPRAGAELADTRAGFVVSKAVGNSVVRHRVSRRLRHLVRFRLGSVPDGATLVVRALPAAAQANTTRLGKDLDSALRKLDLVPSREAASESQPSPAADNNGSAV